MDQETLSGHGVGLIEVRALVRGVMTERLLWTMRKSET